MKLIIDTDEKTLTLMNGTEQSSLPLYSDEAFYLISQQWLKVGWNQKYTYTFTWLGRPIIQLPEDMMRIQEVIYRVKPDVIIETGVAHGGSLVFYASLCKAMGRGRVISIDIQIHPHNREAIEAHELFPYITLVEGNSTDPAIVAQVKGLVKPDETTLVILDSAHNRQHVLNELEAYQNLVTPGAYLVATDGIMKNVSDAPLGKANWDTDHPAAAAADFARRHPEFVLEQPAWSFNESSLQENISYWPQGWLRRKSQ